MKPIIIDMKDMSDSVEVYESKPNPVMVLFIYFLSAMMIIGLVWMNYSKLEVVIKSNGMFRGNGEASEVICEYNGKVVECNVRDGQLVQKGDKLFTLENISKDDTLKYYQEELENIEERIEMLQAYEKYLYGDDQAIETCAENQYMQEITNRRDLLLANIEAGRPNDSGQVKGYRDNIKVMRESIQTYQDKKDKLYKVIEGIKTQTNPFGKEDAYYESILSSYFSNYNLTASQYDANISDYRSLLTDYDKVIQELSDQKNERENLLLNEFMNSTASESNSTEAEGESEENELENGLEEGSEAVSGESVDETVSDPEPDNQNKTKATADAVIKDDAIIKEINERIDKATKEKTEAEKKIEALILEKQKALSTLELQQVASMEQQIETLKGNIQSIEANIATAENQIKVISDSKEEDIEERYMLTEKGNVSAEILSYQEKKKEIENVIEQRSALNDNGTVVAENAGYFYLKSDVRVGSYLQMGSKIGNIYPEQEEEYHADIYVSNDDIGKLHEGQEVRFEIAAYPSSEYGYFTGKVASIAKDIAVDQGSGNAYYLVEVDCDSSELTNKEGKPARLMNGLACQAKIIVGQERILWFFLKKIDLLD